MKIIMSDEALCSLPELEEEARGLSDVELAEIIDIVQGNVPDDELRKLKSLGMRLGHC